MNKFSNRLKLDYKAEAQNFGKLGYPIVDVHSHINGPQAAEIYARVARDYGIGRTYSMTRLSDVEAVRSVLGDAIRFISIPNFGASDREAAFKGYKDDIRAFHSLGARICKFWSAPRARDFASGPNGENLMALDSPLVREAAEVAYDLGMMFMVHIADPNTWFESKYTDEAFYGSKESQYDMFRDFLSRFDRPCIAAHMGGWPENLNFLGSLLREFDHLYLDSSATKWIVREISKHPREDVQGFLSEFKGRVLFGSDIVTSDDHLEMHEDAQSFASALASNSDEAYDLYASRYYALRTLWETNYSGESPIADPDLKMLAPDKHQDTDAPRLQGKELPGDMLKQLYYQSAHDLLWGLEDS